MVNILNVLVKLVESLKATRMGTSGNNVSVAELGTKQNMQAMGAPDTLLPSWLAQEIPSSGLHQDEQERDRTWYQWSRRPA